MARESYAVVADTDKLVGDMEGGDDSSEEAGSESDDIFSRTFGFLWEARDGFVVAQKTALQVACWVTIFAAAAVFYRRVWLESIGFSASTILCNVLFQVGSDLGSTVKNIYYGVIGSFLAWLVYWVFLGIFPEAYDGTNPGVWWAAMTVIFVYTFLFMFLKINETVRFWALISFTGGFAMNLLKPGVEDPHSTGGFKFDYRGAAENTNILFVVAGVLSTLIFCLPPIFSLNRSQKRVVTVLKKLKLNFEALNKYYARETANLEIVSIKEDFVQLRKDLEEAEGYGAASWFESMGTSTKRALTVRLASLIKDLMDTAGPLFQTVADEDFGPSHSAMMRHIQQPMTDVVTSTMKMVEMLIDACEDGSVSKQEKSKLKAEVERIPGLVEVLQKQVKSAQGDIGKNKIQAEVLGEHYVVLTVCYLAQQVKDGSEFFLSYKKPHRPLLDECHNSLGSIIKYDKGDVRWALRSACCLLTNFLIGWRGWCDGPAMLAYEKHPEGQAPVCFITQFTVGLANINVILLSRYSGGTLKAALERVAAVVFASVVGQVGFVALGWCDDTARMLTVVAIFFVTWGFMYFTYDGSPDSQGIAQRLAAITVSSLMSSCSNASGTAVTYSNSYHSLSEIILGVLVMTAFDTFFGERPSASQAAEVLDEAIHGFKEVYRNYFDGQIDETQLPGEVAKVQSDLSEARALAASAVMEPRFWRPTFNSVLFDSIIFSYETFCAELMKINRVLGDDKSLLLDGLPCAGNLKRSMFSCVDQTTEFAAASIARDGETLHDLAMRKQADPDLTAMLVADMNRQVQEPRIKNEAGEMPLAPDSRRSAVATMIQHLMKGMGDLKTTCVKSKLS